MKQRIIIELNIEFDITAAGEFDDSAQHILETELMKYAGVKKVETTILNPLSKPLPTFADGIRKQLQEEKTQPKQKIKIVSFSTPHLWYAKEIGQVYEVEIDGGLFYEVSRNGFPKSIWKEDAEIVKK